MSIKDKINDYLISEGFKLVDFEISDYFGDFYYIYSNQKINVRLISDRLIESIDVSTVFDENRWIDIISFMILKNKNIDLYSNTSAIEQYDFLKNQLFNICDLLDKKNYSSTKNQIKKLEK